MSFQTYIIFQFAPNPPLNYKKKVVERSTFKKENIKCHFNSEHVDLYTSSHVCVDKRINHV